MIIATTHGAGAVPDPPDLHAKPGKHFVVPAGEPPPLPAHCLDAVLDAVGFPLHLVDLRRTPPAMLAEVTAMTGQNLLIDLDPKQAFDAVIHAGASPRRTD